MNKDQNLINEFAIKTLKENLNVMYAQIWREGQLTAEYKRMPVKTRLNTWSACKGVVSCAVGIALDEGIDSSWMRRSLIFFRSMFRKKQKDILVM